MALDANLQKMFDGLLGNNFSELNVTLDEYHQVFEEQFEKTRSLLQAIPNFSRCTEEDITELKNELLIKYYAKCTYQSPEVFSIADPNHIEWLDKKSPKINWNQWNNYSNYLETEKKYSKKNVKAIGQLADKIIDRLEDPNSETDIKVKGLLMGEVQSGKTSTYMAVLHKAIDVGWRFIIILSGMTDDLRFQTQQRINSDLIGYALSEKSNQNCGIREAIPKYNFVNFEALTTLNKDFSVTQLSTVLKKQKDAVYIAVCKKNSRILNNLINWLGGDPNNPKRNADRREIATKIPCLIVDDEADQASPNTSKEAQDFTAVNGAIRNLLQYFHKSAYLAVTATPYANIFINPQLQEQSDKTILPDLFPNNFIFVKESPIGYTGVHQLFGVDENNTESNSNDLEDQVVITIEPKDEETLRKPIKKDAVIKSLPPSLIKALRYFFCCCVFKEITVNSHLSMLVHVDFRRSNHKSISSLIDEFINTERDNVQLHQGLKESELESDRRYKEYKEIWEQGCFSKQASKKTDTFKKLSNKDFYTVWKNNFFEAIDKDKIDIQTINSDYRGEKIADIYEKKKNSKLILVGGYALSRGITIEGLCVTYLTRKSAAIDTLLQMGRFFGYKNDDLKIMKIWLGQNLKEMFEEADKAQQEFITQVQIMNDHKQTPSTFGLKIHKAPAYLKLRIAAKNKMFHSHDMTLGANIAGYTLQSSKLPFEIELLKKNKEIVSSFLKEIDKQSTRNQDLQYGDIVWKNIDSSLIAKLISDFNAYGWGDINKANISDFIKEKLSTEKWIVTVLSNQEVHSKVDLFDIGQQVTVVNSKVYTKVYNKSQHSKFIYFEKGALMRPRDLTRRLSDDQKSDLKAHSSSKNKEITNTNVVRNGPNLKLSPQLIIYSVEPNFYLEAVNEKEYKNLICGLGIGIPCTDDLGRLDIKVKYDVNDIYLLNLEQE